MRNLIILSILCLGALVFVLHPAIAQGIPDGGFPLDCACAQDSTCTVDGGAATMGVTLSKGSFAGSGCVPKACYVVWTGAADTSWPASCPLQ